MEQTKILAVAGMAAAAALGRWRAEAERLTAMSDPVAGKPGDAAFDGERMRDLAAWTSLSLATKDPNPFGCEIVHSATGERLMRGDERGERGERPQLPRRGAHHAAGVREAEVAVV
jgi:hypothetical protein